MLTFRAPLQAFMCAKFAALQQAGHLARQVTCVRGFRFLFRPHLGWVSPALKVPTRGPRLWPTLTFHFCLVPWCWFQAHSFLKICMCIRCLSSSFRAPVFMLAPPGCIGVPLWPSHSCPVHSGFIQIPNVSFPGFSCSPFHVFCGPGFALHLTSVRWHSICSSSSRENGAAV